MPSPFPGMDPYIEACGLWEDFHDDLIHEIKIALAADAPERYLVRTGERSYVALVESEGKETHPFKPDVRITTPRPEGELATTHRGTTVVEPQTEGESVAIRAFITEEYRESFVEIYYQSEREQILVTSLEVLSPSNKRRGSAGWELYFRKRQALLLGAANLVEIDLLREGGRLPMLDPWPGSPYAILVARMSRSPYGQAWAAHVHRRLSPIPVPLASPDADLALDLQPMIERIYQRSRYARTIDYAKPLTPPLAPEEAAWLDQQLPAIAVPPKRTPAKRRPRRQ